MPKNCHKGCDPQTDETGIDCDGNFIGEECVILAQNTYFDLDEGDRLSDLIAVIGVKFQNLFLNKLSSNLTVYADDATAISDGLVVGSFYLTPDGYVKKIVAP